MKIETKYDIGQEVWVKTMGKSYCATITAIHIDKNGLLYNIKYLLAKKKKTFSPPKKNYLKVCNMNQEEFKRKIEDPIDKLATANIRSKKDSEQVFWRRIELSSTIARTVRLCLQYPDLAKEYLDSLPQVTMD